MTLFLLGEDLQNPSHGIFSWGLWNIVSSISYYSPTWNSLNMDLKVWRPVLCLRFLIITIGQPLWESPSKRIKGLSTYLWQSRHMSVTLGSCFLGSLVPVITYMCQIFGLYKVALRRHSRCKKTCAFEPVARREKERPTLVPLVILNMSVFLAEG